MRISRVVVALSILAGVPPFAFAQKRPLTHSDYDSWRHIQNQRLSDDGKFLAYALFPQEGDGELVVRNLTTGKEFREGIGQLPPPPPANFADPLAEGPPVQNRAVTIAFAPGGRAVVFSTFPARAAVDASKKDKKKTAPKGGLRILELGSGQVIRVADVKSFQTSTRGTAFVAYLRESAVAEAAPVESEKRKEYGSELVLHDLASGAEVKFAAVTEFALSKDAKYLAFAVSSKDESANGVYVVRPGDAAPAKALASGAGAYSKLAFDEKQDALAFFGASQLWLWRTADSSARAVVPASSPSLPPNSVLRTRSAIAFSKDGEHVFFGYAPKAAARPSDSIPAEDRVSVDLWHWRDDYIQPMQKVRAATERTRSFRAAYHVASQKVVPLGDATMPEVVPSEDGRYSLGGDDREYRRMIEYDERYADSFLVDNLTGDRKLLARKHLGRVSWSPDGHHALFFNGKDWIGLSIPDGKTTNLTSSIGPKFWTEEHDSPGSPQAYGMAGWTKDGKSVLLYDHYDIWQVAPDGSWAKNITQNQGRQNHLIFRYVKLDADPEEKAIDPAKPLLLRAEHPDSRDSGYYSASLTGNAAPRKLMFGPKNFSNPIKAKNADVLVLTESTFREFPDLQITDLSFKELRKVSDANPQQAGILWGSAELVHYRNTDGIPLDAVLYKPDNFDPKKKYPMIVYIYERLTQGFNTYTEPRPGHSINISYYVSNGYLVLTPDIVYKVGYPGQSALKCVLPAVQAVADRGFVDDNAIGIQGHSWGGYQIAYMITQTNRFRAVAAGAPVANMTSAYDGIRWGPGLPRQFQYERTQSRIGGTLWEYPMRYIENSPVFMADRVKTPVMMIHNDADDAVPWYQGIEFYLALRRLGKESYLFSYNGEPHGLRRRPNQKDYTLRLQEYFDHYLKGAPEPDWMKRGIPYLEKAGVAVAETDQE